MVDTQNLVHVFLKSTVINHFCYSQCYRYRFCFETNNNDIHLRGHINNLFNNIRGCIYRRNSSLWISTFAFKLKYFHQFYRNVKCYFPSNLAGTLLKILMNMPSLCFLMVLSLSSNFGTRHKSDTQ